MPRLISLVLMLFPVTAGGQPAWFADSLGAFVSAEAAANRFSGVVLVAGSGGTIFQRAFGQANRTAARDNTMETRFNLASGDKLFTKLAIVQLALRGQLAFTDTVGRFLPDYRNALVRSTVTIEQLLRHTSGLGNYWTDAYTARRAELRTLRDVQSLFENDSLLAPPGSRMSYSNAGYVLLGRIIESVTGLAYADYVQANIFDRAGMRATRYLTTDEWPPDKAVGYTTSEGTVTDNGHTLSFRGSSAGGGYSTAGDLLKLDAALRSGALVDTLALHRWIATAPGGRQVLANGGGPGANFEFTRVGAHTIIVLSNLDPPNATRVMQRAVQLLPF